MASAEIFEFTDYRLAGFLEARGVSYRGTRRNEKDETVFIFHGGDEVRVLIDAYPTSPEQRYDAACKAMWAVAQVRRKPR